MDAQSFCYWLQGFFEISGATELTESQAKMVHKHLQLVFKKVTPVLNEGLDLSKIEWPTDSVEFPKPLGMPQPPFDYLGRAPILC